MMRWPTGRIVIVPVSLAERASGGAWITPCSAALPSWRWSRVDAAAAVTSNENGCSMPGSASHTTVPAIVSANWNPMGRRIPRPARNDETPRLRRSGTRDDRPGQRTEGDGSAAGDDDRRALDIARLERVRVAHAVGVARAAGRAVAVVAEEDRAAGRWEEHTSE